MEVVARQYVVGARLKGFKVTVGFLVKGARSGEAARLKLQQHLDETGKPFTALRRVRVATDRHLELFKSYKDCVVE